jgi:pimeloyl-ACP methyl ester carboxylesterase
LPDASHIPIQEMQTKYSPGLPKTLRYTRTIGLRLAVWAAILFFAQDKLLLRPGKEGGGGALVSRAGWSTEWREAGQFRGKLYSAVGDTKGTVLVYHGNAGTVDDRENLAQALTNRGFRVVLAEYPGFGAREGWATVNASLSAAQEDFSLAQARWPGPFYVVGESFGAGIAAQVAGSNPTVVNGVMLFTPWDSLKNVVDAKFLGVPVGLLLHKRLDSAAALAHFPGNLTLVAAGADTLIPPNHARALAKLLPAASYRELPGAGHNTWPSHLTHRDWDQLVTEMTASKAVPAR